MANPNPVKQQRYVDMPKCIRKAFPQGFTPRQRLPGEALPYHINTFAKGNEYKPPVWNAPIR